MEYNIKMVFKEIRYEGMGLIYLPEATSSCGYSRLRQKCTTNDLNRSATHSAGLK
jgi:hypothetical protein